MALRLSWTNRNVVANSVNIYRGNAPLDPLNLPAPLASITNGDTFYVDATAEFGKTYYYILGTKTSNDLILTPNQPILVADNRGAGPSVLKYGDDNLGYFGTVLSADFFSSSNILAAAKTTAGLPGTLFQPTWHKMIRNGKIIYVPDTTFGNATWLSLYQAGLVYGIDANFPADAITAGVTATNQFVKLSLKGEDYKVRLLRGVSDGSHGGITNTDFNDVSMDDIATSLDNEYSDLIYALVNLVPEKQRTVNFADALWDTYVGAPSATSSSANIGPETNQTRIAVQERCTNQQAVNRGKRLIQYSSIGVHSKGYMATIFYQPIGNSVRWLPVIELIDTPTVTVSA